MEDVEDVAEDATGDVGASVPPQAPRTTATPAKPTIVQVRPMVLKDAAARVLRRILRSTGRHPYQPKPSRWLPPGSRGTVFSPAGAVTGATVEILQLHGVGVPGVAPVNVVLTLFVVDAQAAHDQLQRAGAKVVRGLEVTPWGHRSFGIDDPDGLRIWIVEVLPGD